MASLVWPRSNANTIDNSNSTEPTPKIKRTERNSMTLKSEEARSIIAKVPESLIFYTAKKRRPNYLDAWFPRFDRLAADGSVRFWTYSSRPTKRYPD